MGSQRGMPGIGQRRPRIAGVAEAVEQHDGGARAAYANLEGGAVGSDVLDPKRKRAPEGARFLMAHDAFAYFARTAFTPRPAASRRISALSVFSHENAVNVLPFLSVTS